MLTVATDQFGFILCHEIMQKQQDKDMAVPIAKDLLRKYNIQSMSFDKGYWAPENHRILSKLVEDLVLPRKADLTRQNTSVRITKPSSPCAGSILPWNLLSTAWSITA